MARKFTLLLSLSLMLMAQVLASSGEADKKALVRLPDVIDTGKGFSFTRQGIIDVIDDRTRDYSVDVDLMWDAEVALRCNNNKAGFIIDLGNVAMDKVGDITTKEGVRGLNKGNIKQGHSYAVVLANGKGIGLINVVEYEPAKGILVIAWKLHSGKKKDPTKPGK